MKLPATVHVLLADDSRAMRALIKGNFTWPGTSFQFTEVDNGADAVAAYRSRRFDFVLLDNPDKGFSGCSFELIAGLKVELGLERVDLVGGDGRDDVNEGVDDGSMPGQIEGRELLDMADDGLGHVPRIEQGFVLQRYR